MPLWEMVNISSTKDPVRIIMNSNPPESYIPVARHWGKACLKRKVFVCLRKDSKDGDSVDSGGIGFQSLGAATEKALSCVPTKCTCESGGMEIKAYPNDLNTQTGS